MSSKIRSVEYLHGFKEISSFFEILERKGQGTFASVFSVRKKTSPDSGKIYALKMIIPTVELRRVENEIRALRQLGGKHGVIEILSARRIRDHIFILMPFVDFLPFSQYYLTMNEKEIRRYLLHLFRALEHVHRFGIIHRDVKPTNILLDRNTNRYSLVDFGLAHSQSHGDLSNTINTKNSSLSNDFSLQSSYEDVTFRKPLRQSIMFDDIYGPSKRVCVFNLNTSTVRKKQNETSTVSYTSYLSNPSQPSTAGLHGSGSTSIIGAPTSNVKQCGCGNRLTMCRGCWTLPKAAAAQRGGTLGFRPPEVMMRCINQTTAVDIWAVGVIFLTFLTGRYPFIKVEDELDVLHFFSHLLSYERMQRGALSLGKCLLVDPKPIPLNSQETHVEYLREKIIALRKVEKRLMKIPSSLTPSTNLVTQTIDNNNSITNTKTCLFSDYIFTNSAYDLVSKLLDPSPDRRITATEAVKHAFIVGRLKKN